MLDLTQFLHSWAYPLLALLATGFGMWMVGQSAKWLNAHAGFLDAQTREKITDMEEQAIDQGVEVVLAHIQRLGDTHAKVKVDDPLVRFGVQIALNHAGGILRANGADPDEVAAKILAQLPPAAVATDTTGATVKTVPVEAAPLAPVQ